MEPLFGLVVTAIAISIAYLVTSERRRAHLRVWRTAAQSAGLAEVEEAEGGLFEGERVSGRSGDLQVRLEGYRRGKYVHGTKIVVTGLGHGAGGLSLRREGLATAFEKNVVGEREIEIGDPAFDDEYYVQGQAPLALAILDPETRRRLAGLLRGRVAVAGREPIEVDASLGDGVLEVRVKESGFSPEPRAGPGDPRRRARGGALPRRAARRGGAHRGERGPGDGGGRAVEGRADARPRVPEAPGDA